jgi:hypothetical protein
VPHAFLPVKYQASACVDACATAARIRRAVLQHTVRATRIVIGAILVALGAVLSLPFVPGPGLLLVFGGLTVLSYEFEWARRWKHQLHEQFRRLTRRPPHGG